MRLWVPSASWGSILLVAPSLRALSLGPREVSHLHGDPSNLCGCPGFSFMACDLGAVGTRNGYTDPPLDVTSYLLCLHRDLLPFTLRLPQAILEASSFTDLETISNLGLGKSL